MICILQETLREILFSRDKETNYLTHYGFYNLKKIIERTQVLAMIDFPVLYTIINSFLLSKYRPIHQL